MTLATASAGQGGGKSAPLAGVRRKVAGSAAR
jgi:hypothetical protein